MYLFIHSNIAIHQKESSHVKNVAHVYNHVLFFYKSKFDIFVYCFDKSWLYSSFPNF